MDENNNNNDLQNDSMEDLIQRLRASVDAPVDEAHKADPLKANNVESAREDDDLRNLLLAKLEDQAEYDPLRAEVIEMENVDEEIIEAEEIVEDEETNDEEPQASFLTDFQVNGRLLDDVLMNIVWKNIDETTKARLLSDDSLYDYEEDDIQLEIQSVPSDDVFSEGESIPDNDEDNVLSEDEDEIVFSEAEALDPEDTVGESDAELHDPLQMGFDNEAIRNLRRVYGSPYETDEAWRSRADSEVTDTDVEMLLRLGYEESLRHMIGEERVERVKNEKIMCEEVESRNMRPFAYRGTEYSGREMTADVERAYKSDRRSSLAALFYTVVFALIVILYDELPLVLQVSDSLSKSLLGFMSSYMYSLLEILLLLIGILPAYHKIFCGLRSIVRLEPTPYSIASMAVLAALANNICSFFLPNGAVHSLFGGVALTLLAIVFITDHMRVKSEMLAFSVVSSGKEKYVLADGEYVDPHSVTGESEHCFKVKKTPHMLGYFARTGRYAATYTAMNYLFPIALLCAVSCGGMALLLGGGIFDGGVRAFVTAFFLCLPCVIVVGVVFPVLLSNSIISRRGCAVVGTAAPDDYTLRARLGERGRIFFNDGEIMYAAYIKRISLRGDRLAEQYVAMAKKLFCMLGGVLGADAQSDEAFSVNTDGVRLEIAELEEHFLKLYMIDRDDIVEITMGSYDKLTRNGIRLPNENMERVYNDDRRDRVVVYIAFDGQFRLAYSIDYRLTAKFECVASRLVGLGFVSAVSTYDPMISADMLSEKRSADKETLEVCRADHYERSEPERACGIVATGNSLNIVYPLVACERIRAACRWSRVFAVLAMVLGVAGIFTALAFDVQLYIRPWMTAVWQIFWSGVTVLGSVHLINRKTLSVKDPVLRSAPSSDHKKVSKQKKTGKKSKE